MLPQLIDLKPGKHWLRHIQRSKHGANMHLRILQADNRDLDEPLQLVHVA
jgi:hypothetical protein